MASLRWPMTRRITNDSGCAASATSTTSGPLIMNPAGLTYTNVHTMSVAGGEIRGQNRLAIEPFDSGGSNGLEGW